MMKQIFAFAFAFLMMISPIQAGENIVYTNENDQSFEGYLALPDSSEYPGKRPAVLVTHQWKGLGDYERKRADMLADLGYVAFAVDVYGQGVRPESTEEAKTESSRYKNDPDLARDRMQTALDYVRGLSSVQIDNIAAIGYCFGGTMVLELARSGADIDAAVSFHGGLSTKEEASKGDIRAMVQVHHGDADPHVSKEEMDAFLSEMNNSNADWHLIRYADAVHAFTEKEAGSDPSTGVAYNEKADKRSWAYTLQFFDMVFGE